MAPSELLVPGKQGRPFRAFGTPSWALSDTAEMGGKGTQGRQAFTPWPAGALTWGPVRVSYHKQAAKAFPDLQVPVLRTLRLGGPGKGAQSWGLPSSGLPKL